MKLTKKWLNEKNACSYGMEWFLNQNETDSTNVIKNLLSDEVAQKQTQSIDWANWLIVRVMTHTQYIAYAIFAAEQVIDIFEKKYPDNRRPREAINAAKKVLKNNNIKTRAAAASAAAYAYAAYASAAYAASADAASAAAAYYDYTKKEMLIKIINYGLKLLEGK